MAYDVPVARDGSEAEGRKAGATSTTTTTGAAGVLLVRAWVEPYGDRAVRARLLVTDDDGHAATWDTAAGADDICDSVRGWLEHLLGPAGPA